MMTAERFADLMPIDLSTLVLSAQEEFVDLCQNPNDRNLWDKFLKGNLKDPQEMGTITINLVISNRFKGTKFVKTNNFDKVWKPVKDNVDLIFREIIEAYEFALTIQKKPHPKVIATLEAKGIFEGV